MTPCVHVLSVLRLLGVIAHNPNAHRNLIYNIFLSRKKIYNNDDFYILLRVEFDG